MLKVLTLLICLCLVHSAEVTADEDFLISYFKHPQIQKYKDLIEKSYADIGIKITFINIEGERAYKTLDQGITDAEIIIEEVVAEKYTAISIVKPVLTKASFYLLCQKMLPCDERVLNDKNQDIFIEQITLNNLPDDVKQTIHARMTTFTTLESVVEFISRGRTKYALYGFESGSLPTKIKLSFKTYPVYDANLFHGIHKRHQHLVPQLEAALKNNLKMLEIN